MDPGPAARPPSTGGAGGAPDHPREALVASGPACTKPSVLWLDPLTSPPFRCNARCHVKVCASHSSAVTSYAFRKTLHELALTWWGLGPTLTHTAPPGTVTPSRSGPCLMSGCASRSGCGRTTRPLKRPTFPDMRSSLARRDCYGCCVPNARHVGPDSWPANLVTSTGYPHP